MSTNNNVFATLGSEAKTTAIRELAVKAYKMNVTQKFTEEELQEEKHNLSQVSIEIANAEEEKKEFVKTVNEKLKPLVQAKKQHLQNIKRGSYDMLIEVYDYPDYDNREMITVTIDGEIISKRRLHPSENQTSIVKQLAS